MTTHSKYSGSMIYRVPLCPGMATLAAPLPEIDDGNDYTREGDLAHQVLSGVLSGNEAAPYMPGVTPQMREAVMSAVNYVEAIRAEHPDAIVLTEQRFYFPQNVVPGDDASGTVDIFIYSEAARRAWVIDYKHGVGELVSAFENAQLLFYATSICWDVQGLDTITLVILQPRAFNGAAEPQEWTITPDVLVDFQADTERAVAIAESPAAPLIPGEKQCHWCPAGPVCTARERLAIAVITGNTAPTREYDKSKLTPAADLGLDRCAYILAFEDFVKDWFRDVRDYATAQARQGIPVPGQKLVYAQARRQWNTSSNTEKQIAERLASWASVDLDKVFPPKLIGITEAEAMLISVAKANGATPAEAKDFMAWLTIRDTSGNVALVPESDGRAEAVPVQDHYRTVNVDAFNETPPAVLARTASAQGYAAPAAPFFGVAPPNGAVGVASSPPERLIPGLTMPHGEEE